MSLWDKFGKPRIIAGHLYKPGLIEQFLAQPVEKNEGRELRERLLRALKAVGPDDFYGNEAPVMLGRADINEVTAILESGKDLNEALGSTKPTYRETGSGNQGEVAAEITRQWQKENRSSKLEKN